MYVIKSPNAESNFDFSNATAFEAFSEQTTSSTTSTTFQIKLSGQSTINHNAGDLYIFQWYCEAANSNNNATTLFRTQYKESSDTVYVDATNTDVYVGRTDVYIPMTGFTVFNTVNEGDLIDFRIQWAVGTGGTARIKNANAYFFKVSIA